MARTKGSLNKPKVNGGTYNVKLQKQIEGSPITKKNALGFVQWGKMNNMPSLLLGLYNESPTHRACINFEVQSIVGGGIDLEAMKMNGSQIAPNYAESWDSLLRNISLDYALFGTFCIEIIMNKDRKTFSYWHIPADKVRWSPYDEDGQITSYWICNDWTEMSLNPPIEVEAFDMREDSRIEYGKPYLYVYRPYTPTNTYYTSPRYQSGIKSIQSEIEFCNFDLRSATNSFVPSGMLVLDQVEDESERKSIISNIEDMFVGSNNASALMISFRNSMEQQNPTFVPFTASSGNVNLFESANDRTIDRIISSHQIASRTLVGLSQSRSGFNSEGAYLEAAYALYNTLVGNYDRNVIVKTVNHMLNMNGIDTELVLKPLVFSIKEDSQKQSTDTSSSITKDDSKDYESDNVEEKVE